MTFILVVAVLAIIAYLAFFRKKRSAVTPQPEPVPNPNPEPQPSDTPVDPANHDGGLVHPVLNLRPELVVPMPAVAKPKRVRKPRAPRTK